MRTTDGNPSEPERIVGCTFETPIRDSNAGGVLAEGKFALAPMVLFFVGDGVPRPCDVETAVPSEVPSVVGFFAVGDDAFFVASESTADSLACDMEAEVECDVDEVG